MILRFHSRRGLPLCNFLYKRLGSSSQALTEGKFDHLNVRLSFE